MVTVQTNYTRQNPINYEPQIDYTKRSLVQVSALISHPGLTPDGPAAGEWPRTDP